jgi:mannose-6-phosphate isomerase-like protein (cupin superfamily)
MVKSNAFGGNGDIDIKVLATADEMYKGARLFNHVTLNPGCSLGYHPHEHETEFYYILKGEAVFNDNGTEVVLHPGDLGATGYGQCHSLENRTNEIVEFIALIVTE